MSDIERDSIGEKKTIVSSERIFQVEYVTVLILIKVQASTIARYHFN